jgi:hypothetical protein
VTNDRIDEFTIRAETKVSWVVDMGWRGGCVNVRKKDLTFSGASNRRRFSDRRQAYATRQEAAVKVQEMFAEGDRYIEVLRKVHAFLISEGIIKESSNGK